MGLGSSKWIIDFIWLIFLITMFWHFWRDRYELTRTRTWLKTKGRITSCEWTEVGSRLWPKIQYTYQVYDKDLVGEYLFLDTAHNNPNSKYSRNVAYKAAMAYQENTDIEVFYNPNKPEQSALDITMPIKLTVILLLIAGLMVLQLGLMIYHLLPL